MKTLRIQSVLVDFEVMNSNSIDSDPSLQLNSVFGSESYQSLSLRGCSVPSNSSVQQLMSQRCSRVCSQLSLQYHSCTANKTGSCVLLTQKGYQTKVRITFTNYYLGSSNLSLFDKERYG